MISWLETLHAGAKEIGITLSAHEDEQFAKFLELFLARNEHINLTAITDPVDVAAKHFLDSLSVETVWRQKSGEKTIDVGTGGGFPGIPLAIRHPDVHFVLNDSVRKKVDFLRDVATSLPLPNIEPIWARAETLGRDPRYRGSFDVAFARAVAHLGALLEYITPLLKVGGIFIAMKGPSGVVEIADSSHALSLLGAEIRDVQRLDLPNVGERILVVIEKTKKTSDKFPRDAGLIKKKPLYLDTKKGTP